MAVTVTKVESFVFGAHKVCVADVAFDSSYPAGGEPVTAANFGFSREITHIFCNALRDPDSVDNIVVLDYDPANDTLIAGWGDYNPAAEKVLEEVDATTDLSAYTARVVAVGK